MRICLIYDCLFPHTVGGAERWYRNLAGELSAEGHDVTYLTLRQWKRNCPPDLEGVSVRTVGPRMSLYTSSGRRRILPPVFFGFGVLVHLLFRRRSYDVVHTASFPYFSLIAAALTRRWCGVQLVVDWHELWSRAYWNEYLGRIGGRIGHAVQSTCAQVQHRAFCFSELHAARLRAAGFHGQLAVLRGEFNGDLDTVPQFGTEPLVVYAGRHIPEKQVSAIVPAVAEARKLIPSLRAEIYGDGPERARVQEAVRDAGLEESVKVPGFVASEIIDDALARAMCLVLPSRREGYGLVVVEAAAHGTPSIVIAGPDNAAVELIEHGVNGIVAASASELSSAIIAVHAGGEDFRHSTADWFAKGREPLSLRNSLTAVLATYRPAQDRVPESLPA